MQKFSLEQIAEEIQYGKTKGYFEEVLSSYNNGNYRSAVVILWSVAICDIIYKLQSLIDLYDDSSAKEILNEVTDMQKHDYKSSAWEIKLLDDVHKKTFLLDSSEYEDLRYLQKQRHLSAHPVLNSERELHSPNKETVRSLLRNTLEGLLIKPPFFTQRIMNELLEDIAESADILNSRVKVKKYVESRYLTRTKPNVEISLFRSFWKFVFKLENDECKKNRTINLFVLEVLSNRNNSLIQSEIKGDCDYYSNIATSEFPLSFLIVYLSRNPDLFQLLSQDARIKIEHCIKTYRIGKMLGWFIKDDLNKHGTDLVEWIRSDDCPEFKVSELDFILKISDSEEWEELFCKIVTEYYTRSRSYNEADTRYQVTIQNYISLFNREALIYLAEQIDGNSQCCNRYMACEDYKIIKERIDSVFDEDFDYEKVPSFSVIVRNNGSVQ